MRDRRTFQHSFRNFDGIARFNLSESKLLYHTLTFLKMCENSHPILKYRHRYTLPLSDNSCRFATNILSDVVLEKNETCFLLEQNFLLFVF
jgi:hypothetical protein